MDLNNAATRGVLAARVFLHSRVLDLCEIDLCSAVLI